jgi:hypothetical protein
MLLFKDNKIYNHVNSHRLMVFHYIMDKLIKYMINGLLQLLIALQITFYSM